MTFFYRFVVVPLVAIAVPFLYVFDRKVRRGLRLRAKRREIPKFNARPLWIHAASGEFEYAKPVIRELKKRHPEVPIVATYFSPTFALAVENFPGVDFAMPLPLDLPGPCAAFIRAINPRRALIARTDFWPELLGQLRRRQIPAEVFSYTEKAGRPRWLTRLRGDLVERIECVSAADAALLEAAQVRCAVGVLGDTRYDQVKFRLENPKPLPKGLEPSKPCLVAGSTWSEDEKVLLDALSPALREGRLQLILVPHEPTDAHVAKLRADLRYRGLTYALFSERAGWSDKSILLVDKVGLLAELYPWGDLAFVGGSFKKSVHSVMEALGAGLKTFVGPKHRNNREALEFKDLRLDGQSPLVSVDDAAELRAAVDQALAHADQLKTLRAQILAEFTKRLGATSRLVERLAREW